MVSKEEEGMVFGSTGGKGLFSGLTGRERLVYWIEVERRAVLQGHGKNNG